MSRARIIDHYLNLSKQADFEIDVIRKELEAAGVDDEEIRIIVRLVDNDIQRRGMIKANNGYHREIMYAGLFVSATGFILTAGTLFGWLDSGNSWVFAYGPLFGGMGMFLYGRAGLNK